MKLIITIELGNDAFYPHADLEIRRILIELADKLPDAEKEGDYRVLHDSNGNTVGEAKIK